MSRKVGAFLALFFPAVLACSSVRRDPSAVVQARLLMSSGDEARAVGDPAGAARSYSRALASARAADDQSLTADLGYRLGMALLSAGQPKEAEVQLQDAASSARRIGAGRLAGRALLGLARARQDAKATPATVTDALKMALEAGKACGDPQAEALAHVGLAALAPYAEALVHLDEAARLASGDPVVAAPLALSRARWAERREESSAFALYQSAADLYRELEDVTGLQEALAGAARAADRAPVGQESVAAELHRRAASAALRAGAKAAAANELRLAAKDCGRAGDSDCAMRRAAEASRLETDPP